MKTNLHDAENLCKHGFSGLASRRACETTRLVAIQVIIKIRQAFCARAIE